MIALMHKVGDESITQSREGMFEIDDHTDDFSTSFKSYLHNK